jgi:hypothetical protein
VHLVKVYATGGDDNFIKTVSFKIISVYAHVSPCTGSQCECNENTDSLSNVGVGRCDHSVLGKFVLRKLP